MGTNYNPCVATDGLILYLDAFNSSSYAGTGTTWYDISGNSNHATLVSSPAYTVSNGGTFVLDGSSNYFTLPNNSILSVSNFTISIWVKLAQLNADQYLIDTSSNFNFGYGYSFRIRSNNTIRFWAYDANNALDTTDTVSSNTWYHITVSYNNTSKTQKIYINGSLSVSGQHTNSFVAATVSYLRIGVSQVLGGYTKGVIAQAQFYNRELAAADIQQNYYATKKRYSPEENIVRDGLVFHYDAGKAASYSGIGVTIFDLSGIGNTGTLINGPTFSSLNGGSIVFDGSNDYFEAPHSASLDISGSITVDVWVYMTSINNSSDMNLICKYSNAGGASNQSWILFKSTGNYSAFSPNGTANNNEFVWLATSAGNTGGAFIGTGEQVLANTWYNVVALYNSSNDKIDIYINGQLKSSATRTGQTSGVLSTNLRNLQIGGTPLDSNRWIQGRIPIARVYNRALTQQEISQNYNAVKNRYGLS
jgi:hypothetical protein